MKYEITDEVKNIIVQMCDIALKAGGLQNKVAVDTVLGVFKVNPTEGIEPLLGNGKK